MLHNDLAPSVTTSPPSLPAPTNVESAPSRRKRSDACARSSSPRASLRLVEERPDLVDGLEGGRSLPLCVLEAFTDGRGGAGEEIRSSHR